MTVKTIIRRPVLADLINLAKQAFLQGKYENIEVLAEELGVSRATAYKWVGNNEQLLSQVIIENAIDMFAKAESDTTASGAERICQVLMNVSGQVFSLAPLTKMLQSNPEKTLRMVASKTTSVQREIIVLLEKIINQEQRQGNLALPYDARTMAYILVRICESFLYADIIAGEAVDNQKLEVTLRVLLGVTPQQS